MLPRSYSTAVLLSLALCTATHAQTAKPAPPANPKPAPVVTASDNTAGVLRSINDTEADLDGNDAKGKPRIFVFILTKSTIRVACKKGDAVNIEYEARVDTTTHRTRLYATSIELAGSEPGHSQVDPGGVGGVTEVTPPRPLPSMRMHELAPAPTQQAKTDQSPNPSTIAPDTKAAVAERGSDPPSETPASPYDMPLTLADASTTDTSTTLATSAGAPAGQPETPTTAPATAATELPDYTTAFGSNAATANPQLTQWLLTKLYPPTLVTADQSDILTPGAVVILHKDGLLMTSTVDSNPAASIYRDGTIESNTLHNSGRLAFKSWSGMHPTTPGTNPLAATRKFVAGEKCWITDVKVRNDGVIIQFYSDPYNDVRYHGELKFPIDRSSPPSAQTLLQTIQQVVTVEPENSPTTGNTLASVAASAAPAAAPAPAAMAPIPPPAAAAAPAVTLQIGMTRDAVIAAFGQPRRLEKIGSREIYIYPDMKITFTNGRVSNVE